MTEFVNVVVVRHPNDKRTFVFRAPDNAGYILDVGDYVLCDTSKGPGQIARCITPQFRISDFHLREFYNVEIKDLRPVTAYLRPIAFVLKKECSHAED